VLFGATFILSHQRDECVADSTVANDGVTLASELLGKHLIGAAEQPQLINRFHLLYEGAPRIGHLSKWPGGKLLSDLLKGKFECCRRLLQSSPLEFCRGSFAAEPLTRDIGHNDLLPNNLITKKDFPAIGKQPPDRENPFVPFHELGNKIFVVGSQPKSSPSSPRWSSSFSLDREHKLKLELQRSRRFLEY
jgi:hypothetical protein